MAFVFCLLLSAFHLCLWFGLNNSADFTVSECFDSREPNQQGSVTITCPESYAISVDDAFFGSNKWGECIITEDDCVEQTRIFSVCDGLENCTRTFKTFTRTCGDSTMLVLGYSCVKTYKNRLTSPPAQSTGYPPDEWQPPGVIGSENGSPKRTPGKPVTPKPNSKSGKDSEEIGLIIGCALASFITVVFLVIAIVMVIRRLLQPGGKDEGHQNNSNSSDNGKSVCIKMDCLFCFGGSEASRKNSHDLRMRKKAGSESALQANQSESKLRMAPVGEESIADQGRALSDGGDSTSGETTGLDEDTTRQTSPARHGKLNPEKLPRLRQPPSYKKSTKHVVETSKNTPEKEKAKETDIKRVKSWNRDHENENTLPSSSNRNLSSPQSEVSHSVEKSAGHHKNPTDDKTHSQTTRSHDAVAIVNTLTGSTC